MLFDILRLLSVTIIFSFFLAPRLIKLCYVFYHYKIGLTLSHLLLTLISFIIIFLFFSPLIFFFVLFILSSLDCLRVWELLKSKLLLILYQLLKQPNWRIYWFHDIIFFAFISAFRFCFLNSVWNRNQRCSSWNKIKIKIRKFVRNN